jgi:hypothetical protein
MPLRFRHQDARLPTTPTDATVDPLSLAALLDAVVRDSDHRAVGRLVDIVTELTPSGRTLRVTGLRTQIAGRDTLIAVRQLRALQPPVLLAAAEKTRVLPFERNAGELLLRSDLLGRALIDVTTARLVRAHDILLTRFAGDWRVAGIDPRRAVRLPHRWRRPLGRRSPCLAWEHLEPFVNRTTPSRLRLAHRRLARLHPAQLADLIESASASERDEIFDAVGAVPGLKANVLEELDDERRRALLRTRSNAEVVELLTQLPSDDVADLMLELDQPRRRELLALLPARTRGKVARLLAYNPHTAGGLMSADFLAVAADTTAAEITTAVVASRLRPADLLAVYVHDGEQRLLGAIPLLRLMRASPGCIAAELADDTTTTLTHTDIPQLARLMPTTTSCRCPSSTTSTSCSASSRSTT